MIWLLPLGGCVGKLVRADRFDAIGLVGLTSNQICSGTIVAPGLVLTAGHCVADTATWQAFLPASISFRTPQGIVRAVEGVSYTVNRGEMVAIVTMQLWVNVMPLTGSIGMPLRTSRLPETVPSRFTRRFNPVRGSVTVWK